MTTKIPDGVVERVKEILRLFHRDSCYPDAMDFELDEAARAAGEVFVAWEREQCARYMETTLPHLSLQEYAAHIRARSAPEKE